MPLPGRNERVNSPPVCQNRLVYRLERIYRAPLFQSVAVEIPELVTGVGGRKMGWVTHF